MSETPFARMLGTAPFTKGKKYALNLRCLLFVAAIALATLALTQKINAQAPIPVPGGTAVNQITFAQPGDMGGQNNDIPLYVNGYTQAEIDSIRRVVTYYNDVIDATSSYWHNSTPITLRFVENGTVGTATGGPGGEIMMYRNEGTQDDNFTPGDTPSSQTVMDTYENMLTHEMGHVFGLIFGAGTSTTNEQEGTFTFTTAGYGPLGNYFRAPDGSNIVLNQAYNYNLDTHVLPMLMSPNASSVFGDFWHSGQVKGIGINPEDEEGDPGFGHPWDPAGSLMTYRAYEYNFLTEAELAMLQDVGNVIDRSRFYGRSIYNIYDEVINVNDANNMDFTFTAADETVTTGWTGDGTYGIGLHIARSDDQDIDNNDSPDPTANGNQVVVNTHLVSTGLMGTGIRIEGFNHNVTISENVIVGATGVDGIGVLISGDNDGNSWTSTGSGGIVLNIAGAIDAQQRDENKTLNQIIVVDADTKPYDSINFSGRVKMAGRFDLGPDYVLTIAAGDGLSGAAMTQHAEGIYGEGILEIAAGTLIMEDESILEFSHAAGNHADLIRIEAGVTAEIGDIVLNVLNPENPFIGTYTILTWVDDATFSHEPGTVGVEGLGKPGRKEGVWTGLGTWDEVANALIVQIREGTGNPNLTDNYHLTWTGQYTHTFQDVDDIDQDGDVGEYIEQTIPDTIWVQGDYTTENWKDQFGTEVWFKDQDTVLFNLTGDHDIQIDGTNGNRQVTVSEMYVQGDGNWTFTGDITGNNNGATWDDGDSDPLTNSTEEENALLDGRLIVGHQGYIVNDEGERVYYGNEIFTGTLTLNGNNVFEGGAVVHSGTLQIGNGGGAGNFSGNIHLGSALKYNAVTNSTERLYSQLIFNSSGNHNYADNIDGVGSLTKRGTGVLDMNGHTTHTGTTTIEEGTLRVNYLGGTSALDVHAGAAFGGIDPLASQTIVKGNIKNSGTINNLALLRGRHIANEAGATISNIGNLDVSFSTGQYDRDGDSFVHNPGEGGYVVIPRDAKNRTTGLYEGNYDWNAEGTGFVPNTEGTGELFIDPSDVTDAVTTYGMLYNTDGTIDYVGELTALYYYGDGGTLRNIETISVAQTFDNINNSVSGTRGSVSFVNSLTAKTVYNEGDLTDIGAMAVQNDLTNTADAVMGYIDTIDVGNNFTSTGVTGYVGTLTVGNALNNTGILANIDEIQAATFQNLEQGVVAGVNSIIMASNFTKNGTITVGNTNHVYTEAGYEVGDPIFDKTSGEQIIARGTFVNQGGTIVVGNIEGIADLIDQPAATGISTLTIDGNFESTSGRFVVSLGEGLDENDAFINVVNGDAVINGGTVDIVIAEGMNFLSDQNFTLISVDEGLDPVNPYTLTIETPLTAGDISDPLFAEFFDITFGSGDNSFNFAATRSNTYSNIGTTMNQRAVGKYIDTATIYPSGDFRNVLLALKDTRAGAIERMQTDSSYSITSDPVEACLAQMAGSIYGTETASSFRNTVMVHTTLANVLRRDYNHVSAATDAYISGGMMRLPSDNVWGMIYGHAGSSQFDGNTSGYRQGFSGIMAGFDRKNDQRNRFGFFLSMGEGSLSSDLNDRSISKELMLGHYFRKDTDSTYMLVQAGFGTHRYDTRRHMAFGSLENNTYLNRTALNEHSSFLFTGHFETGLKYRGGIFNLSPYVGLEYTGLLREGFTESNAGSLNLTAERENYHVVRPMFGLRFDSAPFRVQRALASFYGNVAWMYEFDAKKRPTEFEAQFTEAGVFTGSTFTVHGNDPGRDWVQAGFGLNADLNSNLRVFAGYDAYANSQQVLHSANLGFMLQR